jgi:hypothetical protein
MTFLAQVRIKREAPVHTAIRWIEVEAPHYDAARAPLPERARKGGYAAYLLDEVLSVELAQ